MVYVAFFFIFDSLFLFFGISAGVARLIKNAQLLFSFKVFACVECCLKGQLFSIG